MPPFQPSHNPSPRPPPAPVAPRFLGGVFGVVFIGTGITVLCFLWGTSSDDFGSPPLFFRIVGSFMGLAFVAFGGTMAYMMITGRGAQPDPASQLAALSARFPNAPAAPAPAVAGPQGYICPHCGAPLGNNADVSPHGDAKCPFCGTWFNIFAPPPANPA